MKPNNKYITEKGSVMLMVLMIFSVLLILGTSIFTVVKAENKFARIDSINQSAYYVAESGINYVISDIISGIEEIKTEIENDESLSVEDYDNEFFNKFNERFSNKNYSINNFEKNNGQQPTVSISIKSGDSYGEYKIKSIGKIGNSRRQVSSVITLGYVAPEIETPSNPIVEDLLFYTKDFIFSGSYIDWEDGTAVLGPLDTSDLNGGASIQISTIYFDGDVTIDGGSASLGNKNSPGTIYANSDFKLWGGGRDVWGDVRIKGDFKLKDARIHGNVYVGGNVELGWTPVIDKKIYYTGDLHYPNSYNQDLINKCIKVGSVEEWEVPISNISLREDTWYSNNGYEIKGNVSSTVPDNARWLVDNYNYNSWPSWDVNGDGVFDNVVIVSKGDIKINTASKFTGALIAPNGVVELPQGGTIFNGLIISKDSINISGGGSKIYFDELNNIFDISNIPFIFGIENDDGDYNSDFENKANAGKITLNISKIKEN